MNRKLPNYLRMYRKRSGFTQAETAYLLGSGTRTLVSRHERNRRQPGLETILAYEIVFQTPSEKLFEGIFNEIRNRTDQRATLLTKRLAAQVPTAGTLLKLKYLQRITDKANQAEFSVYDSEV